MPATNETVPNRHLSGTELQKIVTDDVARVLARDGMYQPHIGYGRVSYRVTVELQLDNPIYPTHRSVINSRPQPNQPPEIKPGPLPNLTDEAVEVKVERTRKIDNPNKERIKRGMPVTVASRSPQDGKMHERPVTYAPEVLGEGVGADPDEGVVDKTLDPKWTI